MPKPDHVLRKRKRATCIVELGGGFGYARLLIARQHGMRSLLLPGGGLRRQESVVSGAVRELKEEAGLEARAALHIFDFESASTRHSAVLLIPARGDWRPGSDVHELLAMNFSYSSAWDVSAHELYPQLSPGTQGVLRRYMQWRESNGAVLRALERSGLDVDVASFQDGSFLDAGIHSGTYAEMLKDGSVRVAFYDDSEVDGPPHEFGVIIGPDHIATLRQAAAVQDPRTAAEGADVIGELAASFGGFMSVYRWLAARRVPFRTDHRMRHGGSS